MKKDICDGIFDCISVFLVSVGPFFRIIFIGVIGVSAFYGLVIISGCQKQVQYKNIIDEVCEEAMKSCEINIKLEWYQEEA